MTYLMIINASVHSSTFHRFVHLHQHGCILIIEFSCKNFWYIRSSAFLISLSETSSFLSLPFIIVQMNVPY